MKKYLALTAMAALLASCVQDDGLFLQGQDTPISISSVEVNDLQSTRADGTPLTTGSFGLYVTGTNLDSKYIGDNIQYKYVKNGKMCLFIHTMNCTDENNEILPDAERQVDYINFEHIVPYPLIDATAISVKVINNSGGPVILREVYFSSSRDISAGQAADQITSASSITAWKVHRDSVDTSIINKIEFIHDDDSIDTVELFADDYHNLTAVRINNGILITGEDVLDE